MRNAERFLAQGKIRAAINEYKRVVESDPKDFTTLNMLGDLYAKTSDTKEAVNCFNLVAEYYGQQGFSQKAIAVYNKLSRLKPDSLEVSAKLAELYQLKGSIAEARSHYKSLAEQYERKGNKTEALAVLKQIAEIDPNNSEIYLQIAKYSLDANNPDEAASAFIEAGLRLSRKKQYENAISTLNKGLDLRPNDLQGLKGIVEAQINLGDTEEAAQVLEKVLEKEPYNREVIFLLIDCYLDTNNPQEAERIVIQLVEREPANYPKFLDVAESYLKNGDPDSAARILTMTSEHLLVGGQAKELEKWINEILARKSEHMEGLRLLVRMHGWQRNESELKDALERLVEAARQNESIEDERYALTQLIIMLPYESSYAERLQQINQLYGHTEVPIDVQPPMAIGEETNQENAFESTSLSATPDYFESSNGQSADVVVDYAEFAPTTLGGNGNGNDTLHAVNEFVGAEVIDDYGAGFTNSEEPNHKQELAPFEQAHLQQEIESAEFYVSQGFQDLALKSLDDLEKEYGKHPEIERLRQSLNVEDSVQSATAYAPAEINFAVEETVPVPMISEPVIEQNFDIPVETEFVETEINEPKPQTKDVKSFDLLDEFRDELGLEEAPPEADEDDFETHYQLGIAYKEMGLMEDAIRELQDAVKLSNANDGTRRFFLTCNLLGHCFLEREMPNLAVMWYKRCLETVNLAQDERHGLCYEVANAYEAGNERQNAIKYFEQIYFENVDYRDVRERLEFLREE